MNIIQLEVFIYVVELKSISLASRRLKISSAAVSKQIKNLENKVGLQLIKRSSSFFEVTEIGMIFYEKSKKIFDDMNNLKNLSIILSRKPSRGIKNLF